MSTATRAKRPTLTVDDLILGFDRALRSLHGVYPRQTRPSPASDLPEAELSETQRDHVAGLMRINHVGEICAQALYESQSLTARDVETRRHMQQAAAEEIDHMAWCEQRLQQLDSRTSLLNPFWYAGSFAMGLLAGLAGREWNLGFVVETERQVEAHLEGHLQALPEADRRSRAILEQMKADEMRHAQQAQDAGGRPLPALVRKAMRLASGIMTRTAYRV